MPPCWIFDFQNFNFLMVGRVKKVNVHHGGKFCEIAIFPFFKMAAAAILDFSILMVGRVKSSNCVTTPNFAAIGQNVAETWRYFDFSRWRPPPSWISKMSEFYGWEGSRGSKCVTVPNFAAIGQNVAEI